MSIGQEYLLKMVKEYVKGLEDHEKKDLDDYWPDSTGRTNKMHFRKPEDPHE